ncbi:hypothetical protein OPIT5_16680 [Opitutaceae bacterium TAV5]|nr:hypothetical protein OPIT5_16680 [Opitutaceae bacterium TAV5]
MALIVNPILGIEGVTAGGNATGSLRVGPRYHTLVFFTYLNGALVAADSVIGRVRLMVNKKDIRSLFAAEILKINAFNKHPDTAGALSIHFAEPWQTDVDAMIRTAWDTTGEQSFTFSLELKTQAEPTDIVRIEAIQVYDNGHLFSADGKTLVKFIMRQLRTTYNAGAGQYDITDKYVGNRIARLFFDGPSNITDLEIVADNLKIHDATRVENNTLLDRYGMDPTQFKYAYVADIIGRTEWLMASETLNLQLESAAGQTITVIDESLTGSFA